MPKSISETLLKLQNSRFRSSFHLSEKDKAYVREKGLETIERHARDLIHSRLSPAYPKNDGKQTPMSGHPVFKAMHGTATCCRGCLYRWYKVPQGQPLSSDQEEKIVRLIMAWIEKQLS